MTAEDLAERLRTARYPRASGCDPVWRVDNMMGPCSVWLTEALMQVMALSPGARVLDVGCGKASSSIFLAREFGVEVVALDLWVAAEENRRRIADAGLSHRVTAVHADARELGDSGELFDAIVSIDAYHYFGTVPGVLSRMTRLLRSGGRIGVVVPGLRVEGDGWPDHLAPWWQDGFETWHSPEWWARLWESEGAVTVDCAGLVPRGGADWLIWTEAWDDWARAHQRQPYELEAQMLRADRDAVLGFARLAATVK